jgi:hypothetical protein
VNPAAEAVSAKVRARWQVRNPRIRIVKGSFMLSWSKRVIVPVLLALSVATLGLATVGSSQARADTTDLTCTFGSGYLAFGQPLQAGGSADFTGSANLSGCYSGDGYSALTQGPVGFGGEATAAPGTNPCSVILDIRLTAVIEWPDGQLSQVSATISTNPADPPLGLSATVTQGPLAGDTASAVPVVLPNLDCPLVGLDSLTVPAFVVSFSS